MRKSIYTDINYDYKTIIIQIKCVKVIKPLLSSSGVEPLMQNRNNNIT